MPLDLHVIRACEFVCLDADKRLDLPASKQLLSKLARACRKRGLDRALIDLRDLPIGPEPMFAPSDLSELVNTFRVAGFRRKQRLALLYRTDPHHGARMFAFISRVKGWNVQAFSEFDEALVWLGDEKSSACGSEAEDVPIRRGKNNRESNG